MEKNWTVKVGFVQVSGGEDVVEDWTKEYGPYTQEDAERLASQLNEKTNYNHHTFRLFAGARAQEHELKDINGILADINSEIDRYLGPLPTRDILRRMKRERRELARDKTPRRRW